MRLNPLFFFLLYIIKSFYNHIHSFNSVWFLETFSKTKLILVCKSTDYVISSLIGFNSNYINIYFFFNMTNSNFLSLSGQDNKRTGLVSSDASVGDKIRYYTTYFFLILYPQTSITAITMDFRNFKFSKSATKVLINISKYCEDKGTNTLQV